MISVASSKFSDAAGNTNNDGSDSNNTVNLSVDTTVSSLNLNDNNTFTVSTGSGDGLWIKLTVNTSKTDFQNSLIIKDQNEINNPNCVKVITDKDNFALYFSRSPIPFHRDSEVETQYFKHKGVYAFRKAPLLEFTKLSTEQLEASEKIECIRFLEHGKKIKMVETTIQGIEIDTPEDLAKAQKLWLNNNSPKSN